MGSGLEQHETVYLPGVQVSYCSIDFYVGRQQPVYVPDMYARYRMSFLSVRRACRFNVVSKWFPNGF